MHPIIERHAGDSLTDYRHKQIEIRRHKPTGATSYAGLMMCGSPWVCPVCSAIVTERRAQEVEAALSKHLAGGGVAYFVTYTVPHLRSDSLEPLLEGFNKARSAMRGQRRYKNIMSRIEALGDVYAVEIPYSNNGWHPHGHSLIFAQTAIDESVVADELYTLWSNAVANRNELGHTSRAAFDVQLINTPEQAEQVGNYLAKSTGGKEETWGPGRELAKGPAKISRNSGASAFELLRIYHDADDQTAHGLRLSGHQQAAALFVEFGKATKGRRQLRWAKGLRDSLGMSPEKDDQELAQEAQPDTEILGVIPYQDWKLVTRNNLAGDLLEIARLDGWPGVLEVLRFLRTKHQTPPPN